MNRIIQISLIFSIGIIGISCSEGVGCNVDDNQTLLQEFNADSVRISLFTEDHGAYGSIVVLRVYNLRNNQVLEEISLRGEDYLPKIYQMEKETIYIQYQFPGNAGTNAVDTLPFDNIVLGEALINKNILKYKYVFTNLQPDLNSRFH